MLRAVNLVLIDNTGERAVAEAVVRLGAAHFESSPVTMNYLHGHANIGYGAAHNLVMHGGNTHFHLVLNPDVELSEESLSVALHYFEEHEDVGVVVPAMFRTGRDARIRVQALSERARSRAAWLRAARAAARCSAAASIATRCATSIGTNVVSPVPVMSGSFMLIRRKAIESTGGFDPNFFLYFEDFDWSVRLNRVTRSAYVPGVRVVHHGGRAARKGLRHVAYFLRSGARFFNKHGWKWI